MYLVAVYRAWGAQIPSTTSPWRLNFVRRRLILVGILYGTCCMSPLWHHFCNSSQDFFFIFCTAALCCVCYVCVCVCVSSCTIQSSHYSINQQHVSITLDRFTWYVHTMQVLNLYYSLLCPAYWTQDMNIGLVICCKVLYYWNSCWKSSQRPDSFYV